MDPNVYTPTKYEAKASEMRDAPKILQEIMDCSHPS